MKKLISLLLALPVILVLAVASVYADVETSSDTATVSVMVQPQVEVMLTVDPDEYDFGILPVNTSSNSASGVELRNEGQVGVTLESQVTAITSDSEVDWTIDTSTGLNTFSLYHAVNPTRLDLEEYVTDHKLYLDYLIELRDVDADGAQAEIDHGETAQSWFRIDMPTAVEDSDQRTITVEVLATSR